MDRETGGDSGQMGMTPDFESERLIKSVDRIRDLGEVFTPSTTITAMLDMLPQDVWAAHPSATILEPACGDGNFLVAVLQRKLDGVRRAYEAGNLPAGTHIESLAFHGLEALAAIYGVDISRENILGGVPGHEFGARYRLIAQLKAWYADLTATQLTKQSQLLRAAEWIVDRNVQIGDMLRLMPDCPADERRDVWVVEYTWAPESEEVSVSRTSLKNILQETDDARTGVLSLFESESPPLWRGNPLELYRATVPSAALASGATRNELARTRR